MSRTVDLCKVDFITRYLRLERELPSKKNIYYSLLPGDLWKDYYHFAYWAWCYCHNWKWGKEKLKIGHKIKKQNRLSVLRADFLNRFNILYNKTTQNNFLILNEEYSGLWRSKNHFLKTKSYYISKRYIDSSRL